MTLLNDPIARPQIICPVCSQIVELTARLNGYIKHHYSLTDGSICRASNKSVAMIPALSRGEYCDD